MPDKKPTTLEDALIDIGKKEKEIDDLKVSVSENEAIIASQSETIKKLKYKKSISDIKRRDDKHKMGKIIKATLGVV